MQYSHHVFRATLRVPGAERLFLIIGEGADDGDRAGPGVERQQRPLVLQQHDRLARYPARYRPQLGVGGRGPHPIGIAEQAEALLGAQDVHDRGIDEGHRNAIGAQQRGNRVGIDTALHVHVDTRHERAPPGLCLRARDAVLNQFRDRRPVTHYESLESPLVAQHRAGEPGVPGGWHAGDVVERGHKTGDAGVDGRLERRQVDLAHRALGDLCLVVVATRLGAAVAGEVLRGGEDRLLEAADARGGHHRAKIWILTRTLGDATPARVARDVNHRRVGPVDPERRGFLSRRARGRFRGIGIERARFAERDREDRAIAMDHIEAKEQRDFEPRLGHHDALDRRGVLGSDDVEQPAQLPRAHQLHLLW